MLESEEELDEAGQKDRTGEEAASTELRETMLRQNWVVF